MQGKSIFGRVVVFGVVVVCVFCSVGFGQPWVGSGDANDPYQIWTAADMQAIGADANYWSAHFKLMADIDLGAYTGTSYNIIGISRFTDPFFGVFDGNGHCIFNFTYQYTGYMTYVGLFGAINSGGVKNLKVVNPMIDVPDASYVGTIAGHLGTNVAIRDCCVLGGAITAENDVGGVVGELYHGSVVYSCNTATVQGNNNVGGIVGYAYGGFVTDSYSSGDIIAASSCGGAIGDMNKYAWIIRCYSTGAVSGSSYAGGLVGTSTGRSYRCFWDVTTSNQTSSAEGIGLPTAEMKQVEAYVGWGCSGMWVLDEGVDYPRLIWENTEGSLLPTPSYGGGSGTEEDPYLIYNSEHFNDIGKYECDSDSYFKLMADIVLDPMVDKNFYPIGDPFDFRGVFDGNYHRIFNPRYSQLDPAKDLVAIFCVINGAIKDGIVKNLGIVDPKITSSGSGVGVLAGLLYGGTIENCYVEGGSVSGSDYVGGLAGVMQLWDNNLIANSYAITSVNGTTFVGGLLGYSSAGEVSCCFSAGSVSGEDVGGLIGYGTGGDYSACFWDSDVNPDVNGIGNGDDPNVVGLPTALMQTGSTFTSAGWDFVGEVINGANDIWYCDEPNYPRLSWEAVLSVGIDMDEFWMYQSLPGQSNSDLTASVSVTEDPMGNSGYSYAWEIILAGDVSLAPVTVDGGGAGDAYWTFAARGCDEPGGLSDSGQTFTVRVTVTGDDYGNTGQAEAEFGVALLGDVNNDAIVNVVDRSIANVFWRMGSAGPYTLRDCDVTSDGIVNVVDRSIANAVWRGMTGQNSVSSPCPLR